MATISMKALLEAGAHFGHQPRRWNPKMAKYIFGSRNNIHIIDLQKTAKELKKAYKFLRDSVVEGKGVLFVGTKKQASEIVAQEAQRCGVYWINQRWLGGTLTNFETIKKSIARLQELDRFEKEGIMAALSKKESTQKLKEKARLERSLSGIRTMEKLPGILFVVDPVQEATAVAEARKLEIPVVAICDTNSDPEIIDYPIPGNDDAIRSIKLFVGLMAEAVIEGRELAKKTAVSETAAAEVNLNEETKEKKTIPLPTGELAVEKGNGQTA
ncbi:MAG: 30S ribosomal protein S2 [Elusimicrobiota bacterium]